MDQERVVALQQQIGAHILGHPKYEDQIWDSLSVVVTIEPGRKQANGYVYEGQNWTAKTPSGREFTGLCQELQAAMTPPGAEPWKQALIHITKPGPKINIKFEYDDPTRWSLKKVSLDMADYAESLRPPRD